MENTSRKLYAWMVGHFATWPWLMVSAIGIGFFYVLAVQVRNYEVRKVTSEVQAFAGRLGRLREELALQAAQHQLDIYNKVGGSSYRLRFVDEFLDENLYVVTLGRGEVFVPLQYLDFNFGTVVADVHGSRTVQVMTVAVTALGVFWLGGLLLFLTRKILLLSSELLKWKILFGKSRITPREVGNHAAEVSVILKHP